MRNVKVVVFDLFDTLLQDIKFDFLAGLLYLHDNILLNSIEKEEFLNYANTYWKGQYDKRDLDHSEISFENEILDFKNRFGFRVDFLLEDIAYNCAIIMNEAILFDDTIAILEKLSSFNTPVYLLSNSIFNKKVMTRFLDQYNLGRYFKNTYFSADYNIRKPHKDFFQVVMDDIKEYDNSILKEEVLFIGDNYTADILGAKNFGFTPTFLNRKGIPNINTEDCIEIHSLKELERII